MLAGCCGEQLAGNGFASGEGDAPAEGREDDVFGSGGGLLAAEDEPKRHPGFGSDRARQVTAGHPYTDLPKLRPAWVAPGLTLRVAEHCSLPPD